MGKENSKINLPLKKREEYIKTRTFNSDGDIIEKKCSVCDVFKPIGEFHNNKITFDGTYPNCKECQKKRVKKSDKIRNDKKKGILDSDLDDMFRDIKYEL